MRIARYAAVALAALVLTNSVVQAQVDILYNPINGNLSLESPARTIAVFEATSAGNLFIPGNIAPGVLTSPFDRITPGLLFKLSPGAGAYHSIDFGNILTRNITLNVIFADLSINGSLTPDGSGNNGLDAGGLGFVMSFPDDDDGLLDVMELPRFPDPVLYGHRIEDLDGLHFIQGAVSRQSLALAGRNLSIESGDFEGFPNLEYLTLGTIYADFVDCWEESHGDDPSDVRLVCDPDVYRSSISKMQPGSFQGLSNLEYLHLADAEIEILEPGAFAGLPKMERLHLEFNGVEKIESGVFDGLHELQVLRLFGNQIKEIESGAFAGLSHLTSLNFLGDPWDDDNSEIAIADFSKASFGQLSHVFTYDYVPNALEQDPNFEVEERTRFPQSDKLILDDASVSGTMSNNEFTWERGSEHGLGVDLTPLQGVCEGSPDLIQCRGDFGLEDFFSQVKPIEASLVGTRFVGIDCRIEFDDMARDPYKLVCVEAAKPARLLKGATRLDQLTVDQHLYDSYAQELDAFAAEEGNTLTIIGYGDANADGFFNSSDLVQVFQAGEYEDGIDNNSYWSTGDWYQDGEFNSADIVFAFQLGQYEVEAAVVAVPEPSAVALLLLGLIALSRSRARIR